MKHTCPPQTSFSGISSRKYQCVNRFIHKEKHCCFLKIMLQKQGGRGAPSCPKQRQMVKFCDISTMAFTFQASNNDDLETKTCRNIIKWQTRTCRVNRYGPGCLQGLSLDLPALFFSLFLCSVSFFYDSMYCFCNKKKYRPDVRLACSCKPGWPPWSLRLFCVLTVLTHHMLIFLLPLLESVMFSLLSSPLKPPVHWHSSKSSDQNAISIFSAPRALQTQTECESTWLLEPPPHLSCSSNPPSPCCP